MAPESSSRTSRTFTLNLKLKAENISDNWMAVIVLKKKISKHPNRPQGLLLQVIKWNPKARLRKKLKLIANFR